MRPLIILPPYPVFVHLLLPILTEAPPPPVQMYRDPFNQVISSYNYHAQVPTPEKRIRKYTKPVMPSEHSARCDTIPIERCRP